MAVQIDFLKSIAFFDKLSPLELESVKKYMFEKTVAKGEIILLEAEPPEALYLVASGVVKVFKTSASGKEQILYYVRSGESFNDISAFDGRPNPASAQAVGPATIYGIRKADLNLILHTYPQVATNVIKVISQRVRHLVSLVEDLSFRRVTDRVAKILLEYVSDGSSRQRLTQQEMAAIAGTAREMVGRSLKSLEEEGIVRLDHHRIVITNLKALRDLASRV